MSDKPRQTPSPPPDELASKAFHFFLMVAVGALTVLVALLLRQNNQLKAQLEMKKRVEAATAAPGLAIGEFVEALEITPQGGTGERLAFGPGKPAILVLFVARECGYCEKTIPLWTSVLRDTRDSLARAKGPGIRIVGIIADPEEGQDLKPIAPEVPTYRVTDGAKTWLRRVNATPSAVLLSPEGRVEDLWIGEMSGKQADEMRSALLAAAAR
ncbi:MAG: hypothetical protein U0570_01865 [Phycisphaerales bacterium]